MSANLDLGPLKVVIGSTCSGAWPEIVEECVDPSTGEKWHREIGRTETCYVETDAARASDEMPGTYEDAPHRFALKEGGEESLAIANLFSSAPNLLVMLQQAEKCISSAVRIEQYAHDEPPCPVSKWDYEADQLAGEIRAAIDKATGESK